MVESSHRFTIDKGTQKKALATQTSELCVMEKGFCMMRPFSTLPRPTLAGLRCCHIIDRIHCSSWNTNTRVMIGAKIGINCASTRDRYLRTRQFHHLGVYPFQWQCRDIVCSIPMAQLSMSSRPCYYVNEHPIWRTSCAMLHADCRARVSCSIFTCNAEEQE